MTHSTTASTQGEGKPLVSDEEIKTLVDKHFKGYYASLQMQSVEYFVKTGRISGSFYSTLKELIRESYSELEVRNTELHLKIINLSKEVFLYQHTLSSREQEIKELKRELTDGEIEAALQSLGQPISQEHLSGARWYRNYMRSRRSSEPTNQTP